MGLILPRLAGLPLTGRTPVDRTRFTFWSRTSEEAAMPVPDQRDPELTRRVLTEWLGRHLPGVEITHLQTPQTSGFSSETLIFDAEHEGVTEALVARVAPVRYQVFPEP